jgi:hypothetical protein
MEERIAESRAALFSFALLSKVTYKPVVRTGRAQSNKYDSLPLRQSPDDRKLLSKREDQKAEIE